MTTWITRASAKLNLTLEVIGKRDDGFHDLASIAISLDLADEVRLTPWNSARTISYRSEGGRRASIETDDDIVARAWDELDRHVGIPSGASIEVVKRIPVTAGLGGGSTDAAAFLRLARTAWDLPLSDEALCRIGAQVGSDVPACIVGGTVRMFGRGERVEPLSDPTNALEGCTVLLHRPEIPVPANKTATMYRSLRSSDFRRGDATETLAARIMNGSPPTQDDCVNSFDRPAREVMQGLAAAWRRMGAALARSTLELGDEPVMPLLAGAGPTIFALLSPQVATHAARQLQRSNGFTASARPLSSSESTEIWTV
ncbi:MAG: 4-(cytidine 5'-diphospho)-2-C-methyl-D-erythritol kinase [Chloroflexota bacterium]|nr:4-(cytidine 5'-diphospho)-2-C-methyl-D-erythritol kinase [Chloroflexota bacterium]